MNIMFFLFTVCIAFLAVVIATWQRTLTFSADREWALIILGIGTLLLLTTGAVNYFLGSNIYDIITLSDNLAPRASSFLGFGTGLIFGSILLIFKMANFSGKNK
jgi:hypothetical protein